ncbi:MAG: thiamine pyrophosphate-requiring protein [Planctomycetaceae bacterium]|jgi:acetolactate synthase I/II/III large subunit|nr:thiamine pyrophosphate-requiring protein [Planctomycetaceae bacterium]
MNAADAIAQILKIENVEQVFCFPFTPIIEALAEAGIRPIVARQERVAENMADGFSRTTNGKRLGVVTVQQSAGAENAFAGIAQARTDSSPVLFLPGHPGRDLVGVSPTFDAMRNYAGITKWADMIPSANAVPQRMRRAMTELRSGRPGPVMLEIPVDVAAEEFSCPLEYRPVGPLRSSGSPDAIRDAVKLLLAAKRPMIWAGQGVLYADASSELTELAEQLPAPVMTTLMGKSAFNERHPLALGTGSYSATAMARDYLDRCDAVLAIGASLTKTIFAPVIPVDKRIVHATVDPTDLNKDYVADVPLLGDAKLILQQLLEELRNSRDAIDPSARTAVESHIRGQRETWMDRWKEKLTSDEVPLNPYRVIGDFMKTVDPAEAIVTHDSGNPRDQLVPLYEAVTPRGYIGWGHSTQLGFSLGAAMGAKIAAPEKLVANFMGDAAFGMVGMDVETAVREQIPILTLILNNSAMGNYEKHIPRASERYGTKFLSGNYSEVARGLGAHAERIEQPSEIIPALNRAIDVTREGKPAVLEFITREEAEMATLP